MSKLSSHCLANILSTNLVSSLGSRVAAPVPCAGPSLRFFLLFRVLILRARYQLVPQTSSQAPGPGPSPGSTRSDNSSNGGNGGGGVLQNVFSLFAGHGTQNGGSSGPSGTSSSGGNTQSQANTSSGSDQTSSHRDQHYDIPGGWGDQAD